MIPPTSIDGTDITGATIDGTDVQEITVDGDVVFTSAPTITITDPVAKSDLIAWYPFDSATYGGSNADDVTAILGGTGDDTGYDGTIDGATYQSSAGVTDITAGPNSGAFDFDGSNDNISTNLTNLTTPFTAMFWVSLNDIVTQAILGDWDSTSSDWYINFIDSDFKVTDDIEGGILDSSTFVPNTNEFNHVAGVYGNSKNEIFINGNSINSITFSSNQRTFSGGNGVDIGSLDDQIQHLDGTVDDVRIYNRALTSSEISQIVTNTQP